VKESNDQTFLNSADRQTSRTQTPAFKVMSIRKRAQGIPIWAVSLCTISGLLLGTTPAGLARPRPLLSSVPPCKGITFSASFLADTGEGSRFQFTLANNTEREIRLIEPVPSSAHWYALTHGRWLWRASNGSGGGLFDPMNERGRLVIFKIPLERTPGKSFTVQPHQSRRWVESEQENPVLEYRPGCARCSYPEEYEYHVIFAYAYLPQHKQDEDGLLACGIRSKPVPMPPKPHTDGNAVGR
jgi:hypothetical protein